MTHTHTCCLLPGLLHSKQQVLLHQPSMKARLRPNGRHLINPHPQAARLELARATALHPYTRSSSSSTTTPRPPRASYAAVMSSQADKPPWQAAWDRQMRVVLRLQAAADELASGSVLQDMYDVAVGSGEDLSVAALETVSCRRFRWQCVASTSHSASQYAAIQHCSIRAFHPCVGGGHIHAQHMLFKCL